jgi:hypothetical protein
MQTIPYYLYENELVFTHNTEIENPDRGDFVYARDIKLYQGVVNTLKLTGKNTNQRSVGLTGKTVRLVITSVPDNQLVLDLEAQPVVQSSGLFYVDITPSDLVDVVPGHYQYGIAVSSNDTGVVSAAYTDDNYSTVGTVQVLQGFMPKPAASVELDIVSGASNVVVNSKNSSSHSVQFYTTDFSGRVELLATMIESTTASSSDYLPVADISLTADTGTHIISATGVFSAIRVQITTDSGTVDSVWYRN